jgi:hypothetical protein
MHRRAPSSRAVGSRQFLDDAEEVDGVKLRAPECLRQPKFEQPGVAHCIGEGGRQAPFTLDVVARADDCRDKLPRRI